MKFKIVRKLNDNIVKPSFCARVGCGKIVAAWTHLKEIGWGKLVTVKSEVRAGLFESRLMLIQD